MRNKFVFILLFFCLKLSSKNDSIVLFNYLKFNNEFERELFVSLKSNRLTDKTGLFIGISPESNKQMQTEITNRINNTVKKVAESSEAKKGIDKLIEICFKQVHKEYLKKYELQNFFNEMFNTGNYNCVSATALYSLVFDALNISYEILETPTHVYLTAKGTRPIKVETTDPVYGYFVYNENFKTKYVNDLKKYKLISENEYNNSSTTELFNKYYFSDSTINITQLAGIQYLNAGVYALSKEDFEKALINFEKAYYLYPSQKLTFLLLISAAANIHNIKYDNIEDIYKFIKVVNYRGESNLMKVISDDDLLIEFSKIANINLIQYNRRNLFDEMYEKLSASISDSALSHEFSYIYNYESSRTYYMQNKLSKATEFAEKSYKLKPENLDAQTLLISTFTNKLQNIDDPQTSINEVNAFSEKFPQLIENSSFKSIVCNAHLLSAALMFSYGKVIEAEKQLNKFEELYTSSSDLTLNKDMIVGAYSEAATYYFKRGNQSKAKSKISDGLKYYPDSHKLKSRYDMLK